MAHDLTHLPNGGPQFAYNAQRGNPWHRLGTPVDGDMPLHVMLEASGSDDTVTLEPVYAMTADGFMAISGRHATVSDRFGPIGVVGDAYSVQGQQRRDIAALGAEIVGQSRGDACFDTMGNLGPAGNRFFAYIRFPELVIDPHGIADAIERGLVVATSFDGTMKNTFGLSNVRVVCQNTLSLALAGMANTVTVRHTRNAEERIREAAAAVGYAAAAEAKVREKAEAMLARKGGPAMDRVLDALWPLQGLADGRARTQRANDRREVVHLYENGDFNAKIAGRNGWAVYNAVTEWLDYERSVRAKGGDRQRMRTEQAVDWSGRVPQLKAKAAEAVLA